MNNKKKDLTYQGSTVPIKCDYKRLWCYSMCPTNKVVSFEVCYVQKQSLCIFFNISDNVAFNNSIKPFKSYYVAVK